MKHVPGSTQIQLDKHGMLEVQDNVVFMANTAGRDGGAVSLQSLIRSAFDVF